MLLQNFQIAENQLPLAENSPMKCNEKNSADLKITRLKFYPKNLFIFNKFRLFECLSIVFTTNKMYK